MIIKTNNIEIPRHPQQKLCGGTEHHRDVGRARKESSAAEPERLPCTNSIKLSMSQFTKFLNEQMPLNCKISSTVCCGSLKKVPWAEHAMGSCQGLSLGVAGSSRELLGRAPRLQMDRGLKNTAGSSRSAEAFATVNSPRSLPRAALVCPEKLHKFLTLSMKKEGKKKNTKTLKVPAEVILAQNPVALRNWRPKCQFIMPVLQNLRNCCEPHGVCGYWQATPLIKCNLQQTEESPELWYLSSFIEDWLGLITILKGKQRATTSKQKGKSGKSPAPHEPLPPPRPPQE